MSVFLEGGNERRLPVGGLRGLARQARLDEHLPVDHRLSTVYRVGAGLIGAFLIVFGVLGLIDRIGIFETAEDTVLGLSTNGALSVLSVFVGLVLLTGMVRGGNFASNLNLVLGVLFLLSGFYHLAVLEREANFLNFRMQNVLFSYAVGLLLLVFGMYGRISGRLPHDNPYWRARHPDLDEAERRQRALAASRERELMNARPASARSAEPAGPAGSGRGPGSGRAGRAGLLRRRRHRTRSDR
ncbi:protein of unknown function [Streptomyces aidingensis]|uniref:DUF4383 domain-containing protein n=1 Tax=Streptomyces aidingensis TaxID=910347 RepID=A0A1I1L4H2_9ACTN|nr:DUF4383 domain-containing protein [Streptomyces aidingensis]SFC67422.1 protein of unknown function [Streptomyces aidingensis]